MAYKGKIQKRPTTIVPLITEGLSRSPTSLCGKRAVLLTDVTTTETLVLAAKTTGDFYKLLNFTFSC